MSADCCWSWEILCCKSHWALVCENCPLWNPASVVFVQMPHWRNKAACLRWDSAIPFQSAFVHLSSHHRLSADLRDLQLSKSCGRCSEYSPIPFFVWTRPQKEMTCGQILISFP
jgi:hypothetical protein